MSVCPRYSLWKQIWGAHSVVTRGGQGEELQAYAAGDSKSDCFSMKRRRASGKVTHLKAKLHLFIWDVHEGSGVEMSNKSRQCDNSMPVDQSRFQDVFVIGDSIIRHMGPGLINQGLWNAYQVLVSLI